MNNNSERIGAGAAAHLLGCTIPHLGNLVASGRLSRIDHGYSLAEVLRLARRRSKQPPKGRPTVRAAAVAAIEERRRRQHRGMNAVPGFDDLTPEMAGAVKGDVGQA